MRLRITWVGNSEIRDIEVTASARATVGDLATAMGGVPAVWVDGYELDASAPLGQILDGSVVGPEPVGRVRRPPEGDHLSRRPGTIRFNRPPRIPSPALPPAPEPPERSEPVIEQTPIRWGSVLAPLLLGAVLAVVLAPAMLLFSLFGPAMVLVGAMENGHRARRERRQADRRHTIAMTAYRRDVRRWRDRRIRWGRKVCPDPNTLLDRARRGDPLLWYRGVDHPEFGFVSVGEDETGAPVLLRLERGGTIGFVGDTEQVRSVLRWMLVQAAVHHGPSALGLAIAGGDTTWEFVKWLPHAESTADVRVSIGEHPATPAPDTVALVARATEGALPASVTSVVHVTGDGSVEVRHVETGRIRTGMATGVSSLVAEHVCRDLARFSDPDAASQSLPAVLPLAEIVDVSEDAIIERWHGPWTAVPIGRTTHGMFTLDLRRDGPHALVAGTTGSGKSELLRGLVLSLASHRSPRELVMALIDYKGGATFDRCATLPHVVGVVTDLDEQSAERALHGLEAEVGDRESRLRESGLSDLAECEGDPPFPRLVVIVDEFAAFITQHAQAVDRFVDIARRGRSLGIHLVLATQRPAGVIGERIRANTDLRVALRVQDRADSQDVVGTDMAASIRRDTPGRGVFRQGPDEPILFHAAAVTTSTVARPVEVGAFTWREPPRRPTRDTPRDLDAIVDAIAAAATAAGVAAPDPVWHPPLPEIVDTRTLEVGDRPPGPWVAPIGIVDDARRPRTRWWVGTNVLVVGSNGAGAAASRIAISVAQHIGDVHVHAIGGGQEVGENLTGMVYVGTIANEANGEQSTRLLNHLRETVEARGEMFSSGPAIVLVLGGFPEDWSNLEVVLRAGPQVGVFTFASAFRPAAVPADRSAMFASKLVLGLDDPYDAMSLGVSLPRRMGPNTAVDVASDEVIRLARPSRSAQRGPVMKPVQVEALSPLVRTDPSWRPRRTGVGGWWAPIGRGGTGAVRTVGVHLRAGRHLLITGRRGSGKTTALAALERVLGGAIRVIRVGAETAERAAALGQESSPDPVLWLVDDAHGFDLDLDDVPPGVMVVAGARSSQVSYRHWVRELASAGNGIALAPDIQDEELWQMRLGRVARTPGRGVEVVDGRVGAPMQVAIARYDETSEDRGDDECAFA